MTKENNEFLQYTSNDETIKQSNNSNYLNNFNDLTFMNNNWSSPYKTDTFVNSDNQDDNKFNSNENNMININNRK